MKLRERVQNIIKPLLERMIPDVPSNPMNAKSGLQRNVPTGLEELETANLSRDRHSQSAEIRSMVENDPRWDRMLYKLSSDASYKNFTVVVESADGKRMQKQAQAVIDRTRFLIKDKQKLRGWTKGLLRDGDLFLQLIVDAGTREITDAKKLAAEITHTRMNAVGEFPEDKKPYYQKSPMSPDPEREFEEWEIVHLRWDHEDGQQYGKSVLASSRLAHRRLESGEKDMAVRRKVRAGIKRQHKLGSDSKAATPKDIEDYKKEQKETLNKPGEASQDIFTNHLVEITTLMGDENIGEIEDLKWIEGLFSIATGIPQALLSGGRETATNFTVIKEQEEDYLRVIGDIDEVLEEAFVQIFDFALMLKGINPDSVVYTFNWGAKDREDIDRKVLRAERLQSIGLSFETVFNTMDLDGITYEEELERIKKQKEGGIIPYRGPTSRPRSQTQRGMETEIESPTLEQLVEDIQLIREQLANLDTEGV